eukprot:704960-Karenia_brevis.AAC.1
MLWQLVYFRRALGNLLSAQIGDCISQKAQIGKSRQVGGDGGRPIPDRALAAGLGKSRQVEASPGKWAATP